MRHTPFVTTPSAAGAGVLELCDWLRRVRNQIRIFESSGAALSGAEPRRQRPPLGAPVTGDMYVVGTVPTGAWPGRPTIWRSGPGRRGCSPTAEAGWMAYSVAAGKVYFRDTSAWLPYIAPSAYIQTLMDDVDEATARRRWGWPTCCAMAHRR